MTQTTQTGADGLLGARRTIRLEGIRPTPLASYLSGLGLVRLLATQADPDLTSAWVDDALELTTTIQDVPAWLLRDYAPTPVLSPWNNGTGFDRPDSTAGRALGALVSSTDPRLEEMRRAHVVATEERRRADHVEGSKVELLVRLRNRASDRFLEWLDAAIIVVPSIDSATLVLRYPPMLGTGGNDGRLDFSTNFHQRLGEVVGPLADPGKTRAWAEDLLSGNSSSRLSPSAVGQFDPFLGGGKNSTSFGSIDTWVNPWTFVLMIEGAMMFAAGVTRRMGDTSGKAAMPFTVDLSQDDASATATGENTRGEVWAPVWSEPMTYGETRQLFREARARWQGRSATRGSDMYGATRALGVQRGVDQFVRYGLMERNGLAYSASVLDRVDVREAPEVTLVGPVLRSLDRMGGSSAAVAGAVRIAQLKGLRFLRDPSVDRLVDFMASATDVNLVVGRSAQPPERSSPLSLDASEVVTYLASSSLGWRRDVALAWGSCGFTGPDGVRQSMRHLLVPVTAGRWREEWARSVSVDGLGRRTVDSMLLDVATLRCRSVQALPDKVTVSGVIPFPSQTWTASATSVAAFLASGDDAQLADELKAALALTGWGSVDPQEVWTGTATVRSGLTTALAALARGLPARSQGERTSYAELRGWDSDWPRIAATGGPGAGRLAARVGARCRQSGWPVVVEESRHPARALVAALAGPHRPRHLLAQLDPSPRQRFVKEKL